MLVVQVGKSWEGFAKGSARMSRLDPTGRILEAMAAVGVVGLLVAAGCSVGPRMRLGSNCRVLRKSGMKTTEPTASTCTYEG